MLGMLVESQGPGNNIQTSAPAGSIYQLPVVGRQSEVWKQILDILWLHEQKFGFVL